MSSNVRNAKLQMRDFNNKPLVPDRQGMSISPWCAATIALVLGIGIGLIVTDTVREHQAQKQCVAQHE